MTDRSTTKSAPTRRTEANGSREVKFGVDPPGRKVQVPQLMVAVLVVAVSALVGVVLFSQAAAREPVVALASPIERGQVLTNDDLRVVFVGTDGPIAALSPDEVPSLIGLVAATDLEAATLVTPGLFVGRSSLGADEGVVGLALSPGEYPSLQLAPGDAVDVVDTETGAVLAPAAEVFDVAELGTQGVRFVSLRMPSDTATLVAAAANGPGRLRLVMVPGGER